MELINTLANGALAMTFPTIDNTRINSHPIEFTQDITSVPIGKVNKKNVKSFVIDCWFSFINMIKNYYRVDFWKTIRTEPSVTSTCHLIECRTTVHANMHKWQ